MGFCLRLGPLTPATEAAHRKAWQDLAAAGVETISFNAWLFEGDDHFAAKLRKQWIDEFKFKVSSIHFLDGSYSADCDPAANQRICDDFRKFADMYQDFGAYVIVLHAGSAINSGSLAKDWQFYREAGEKFGEMHVLKVLAENLQSFTDSAKRYNMRVAIENIGGMLPAGDMRTMRILEQLVDRDNFGFCIDTGHAFYGKEEIVDYLDFAGEKLFATHVHDNHGTFDDHLFPGEGDIDWLPVIRKFHSMKYPRELMFECSGLPDPDPVHGLIRAQKRWQEYCSEA